MTYSDFILVPSVFCSVLCTIAKIPLLLPSSCKSPAQQHSTQNTFPFPAAKPREEERGRPSHNLFTAINIATASRKKGSLSQLEGLEEEEEGRKEPLLVGRKWDFRAGQEDASLLFTFCLYAFTVGIAVIVCSTADTKSYIISLTDVIPILKLTYSSCVCTV